MKVALLGNIAKERIRIALPELAAHLETLGVEVAVHENLAGILGDGMAYRPESELFAGADLIVSFGGDGTILHVAGLSRGTGIPILGVNLGKVGFLAEVSPDELETAARRIHGRDYEVLERMAFTSRIDDGTPYMALNDIVLDRNADTRILELAVAVDGEWAGGFFADGLIVATPTGSTAHSVAAGGPLVTPECSVIVLTPICPHSLTIRPMVIDGSREIQIEVAGGLARMAVDGQSFIDVPAGSGVCIRRADAPVPVARFRDKTYFDILRTRLNWGVTPKMKNA